MSSPLSPALQAKLAAKAAMADTRISKAQGYRSSTLTEWLSSLSAGKPVEVGWRESCGRRDFTAKIREEWLKLVAALKREGVSVTTRRVKQENRWATIAGGFWNSEIFELGAPAA